MEPVRPDPAPVAVVGLDDTARALGAALLRAGHDVAWWWPRPGAAGPGAAEDPAAQQDGADQADRTDQAVPRLPEGAVVAPDAAAAVLGRDVVVVRLPDAATLRHVVLDGPAPLADALGPRAVLVDCSPVGPREARASARALEARLLRVLEVSLSGTPRQAAEGTLATHVGGDPETMEDVRPVLEAWTAPGRLTWTGDAGSGAAARVVAATAGAVALQSVGELLRLGRDLGLGRAVVLEVLLGGPLGPVVGGRHRRLREEDAGSAVAPAADVVADVLGELATALRYAGSALPALEGAYLNARLLDAAGRGGDDLVALALEREGRAHLDDDDLAPAPR